MLLPCLEQESVLPLSLSPNLALAPNSCKDVIENVLVSSDPPITLNDFCEIQEGEDLERVSELDMSITPEVEHCDFHKPDDTVL